MTANRNSQKYKSEHDEQLFTIARSGDLVQLEQRGPIQMSATRKVLPH